MKDWNHYWPIQYDRTECGRTRGVRATHVKDEVDCPRCVDLIAGKVTRKDARLTLKHAKRVVHCYQTLPGGEREERGFSVRDLAALFDENKRWKMRAHREDDETLYYSVDVPNQYAYESYRVFTR